MRKEKWSRAGNEPTLWEVLADPIVLSLMRADRIARRDVLSAVASTSDRFELTADGLRITA